METVVIKLISNCLYELGCALRVIHEQDLRAIAIMEDVLAKMKKKPRPD